eukprot:jgi/Tetstr1/423567/TSEL_014239.t2
MKPTFANLLFLVLACSTMGLGGLWWYKQDKQQHAVSTPLSQQGNGSSGNDQPVPKPASRKQLKQQIKMLLAAPVPITLGQEMLRRNVEFSCGGTHVVELKSYHDLRSISRIKEALPHEDLFRASQTGRIFKTCAVVGNSGSLLETQYGEEIDGHDVIIRFNHGITEGYSQFVGTRTTFRVYNGPVSEPKEPGEVTISTIRDRATKKWVSDVREHPGRNDTAYVFDPEFLCYSWQWVKNQGHKPSSGLVGMIFALKICHKVHAYGFQSKNYFSSTSRPHYYDWERPQKGREKVHPFQREMTLYKQLESMGFLTFRNSEPDDK